MRQKGLCGDQELEESPSLLHDKVKQLAELIRTARKCVLFTGAGISTNSGIPDFRGPNGVWTKEIRGVSMKDEEKTPEIFNRARPSYTHHAIVSLVQMGLVHHVISQNVDGLHLRSGLGITQLSELHGNICMEICELCDTQYFREIDIGGMGLNLTGNICTSTECNGKLRDFSIDWDTSLPEDIFQHARKMIREADLCICIGTSLRIRPAGQMPARIIEPNKIRPYKGHLSIINLQKTHLDAKCAIRIFHDCDIVFRMLCSELAIFVDDNKPLVHSAVFPSRRTYLSSSRISGKKRQCSNDEAEFNSEQKSSQDLLEPSQK
jgi:mono-ADP-ribosyltransferase sirtuin 6